MENTTLHAQKIVILSRLIKESSLTLEEALLLLKDEDVQISVQPQPFYPSSTQPYWTTTGPATILSGTSIGTCVTTGNPSSITTNISNVPHTLTADLNN